LQGPQKHHTHYKIIDAGSSGGPNSHVSIGANLFHNGGTFTGRRTLLSPIHMQMVAGMAIA